MIATAVIGSQLVRRQGLQTIAKIQASQRRGEMPAIPMLEGAALLMAGALLVTPGFISDTLGFLMLVPPLRKRVAHKLIARAVVITPAGAGPQPGPGYDPNVIEGDYRRDDTSTDSRDHLRY